MGLKQSHRGRGEGSKTKAQETRNYQNKSGTNSEIQTKTNEKLNTETRLTSQKRHKHRGTTKRTNELKVIHN